MWNYTKTELKEYNGLQYQIEEANQILSYRQVIDLLIHSREFRHSFNDLLADCPYKGFFWEVRPVDNSQLDTPFEFVIIESSTLSTIIADKRAFEAYFQDDQFVATFLNLRGDAKLVVPTPISVKQFYAHLGNFVRNAPEDQIDEFWKKVGETYEKEIGEKKVWLSTAGLGVSWLHIRIDSRPKYYRYNPYKNN